MSADHRKPVVAFVMLALAAGLVVGVQQAEAQGGRLLAAAAGVGAHVQGTISSPPETVGSRGYDRLADLGPTFVSVREVVGHADVSTVSADPDPDTDTGHGTQPAAAGPGTRPAATPTRPSATRAKAGDLTSGKSAAARSVPGGKAPARNPGKAASRPASPKKAGPDGTASTSSVGKARGRSSRSMTEASPGSVASHRSVRPGRRPARVAATSRVTGVPVSAWPRGKAHGQPRGKAHGRR